MRVRKAVIPAAGWGTRFFPLTRVIPKELLPLANKPIIHHCIDEAVACGVELVVVVTREGKDSIRDYLAYLSESEYTHGAKREGQSSHRPTVEAGAPEIRYVHQPQQLGLGHAVLQAQPIIGDEPFIVFLPDDIFEVGEQVLKTMLAIHEEREGTVLVVKHVGRESVTRWGIIKPQRVAEHVYEVLDLVEKPPLGEAPSDMAILGRYILAPEIFDALQTTPPGVNGEIQLTDGLRHLVSRSPVHAYELQGRHYDAGTPLGWLEAQVAVALRDPDSGQELRNRLNDLLDGIR